MKKIKTVKILFAVCAVLCVIGLALVIGYVSGRSTDDKTAAQTAAATAAVTARETAEEIKTTKAATEATTKKRVPTTTAPEQPFNILDSFSADKRRKLNIFLSNFSETESLFEEFNAKNYDDTLLIDFAQVHIQINSPSSVRTNSSGENYITEKDIDNTIRKYFGLTVVPQSSNGLNYRNGRYYLPGLDLNEGVGDYMSVAEKMTKSNDGTYTVTFSVFYIYDSNTREWYDLQTLYGYNREQMNTKTTLKPAYRGKAVIANYTYDEKKTYKLIKYETY